MIDPGIGWYLLMDADKKSDKLCKSIAINSSCLLGRSSMDRRSFLREKQGIDKVEEVKRVVQGDTIVFDSVSRMSRNAQEGFEIYEELYSKGVDLVFLKEPHINTETYKTALENNIKLILLAKEQIRLAFEQAEKEVKDLQQQTREGIETARLNGKQIGMQPGTKLTTKKSIAAKEIIQKNSKDFSGTLSDAEVMKLVGISRNSYYKYKRELRGEM